METANQKERPLVSFIIPYYELPVKMLRECLDSILALSLRTAEREIIVVDDGSDESPLPVLGDYRDQMIYLRQPHGGLSEARNSGLHMASGEYIQFVDADDRLLQAPYEHCLDLMRFSHPEMVVFDFTSTPEEDNIYEDSAIQSGAEYMRNNNLRGTAWGYLFHRSILGDLRFTSGIYHEDEEFTPLLMLRASTLIHTDARAYVYRRRPESIITSSNIRNRLKRLNDAKGVILRLNTIADRLPTEERTALQRRVAQLTMDYLYNVIRQTRSRHYLDRRIEELRRQGLFPLPDRDYTMKYTWFRRLSNSETGLALLMRVIPLIRPER